jgi:DNA-binding response OmpR family regulator
MRRMLVADDDPHILALLVRIGERAGFEVDAATDGVEVLKLMDENRYTIALLDLMMPNLSGYEVLEQMRHRSERPKFIVVTAMAEEYVARITPDLVDAIVRKPFNIKMLGAVIAEVAGAPDKSPNGAGNTQPATGDESSEAKLQH